MADIAAFSAHVVDNRDAFVGKRIDIASDEITAEQTARVLTDILGRPVQHVEVPMDNIRAWSEDLALMYEWFNATGYSADVEGLRARYPEVGWRRFADWAGDTVPNAVPATA